MKVKSVLTLSLPLQVSNEPGNRYSIQLINALVLYVGTQAIAHIHNKGSTPSMSTITHSAHMDIFQNLAVDLDTEGGDLESCTCCCPLPDAHTYSLFFPLVGLPLQVATSSLTPSLTSCATLIATRTTSAAQCCTSLLRPTLRPYRSRSQGEHLPVEESDPRTSRTNQPLTCCCFL